MPKNKVNDPITDKEIAFARLVLSGAMTDRQAAEAVGLHPDSAAYTKSKPRVRAYMLEHRAAVEQQLVQQDVEEQSHPSFDRQQVLDRLWEIAKLSPELTRGSVTGQVKALSIIVAMENYIPNRRAGSPENKLAPVPTPQIDASAWLRRQQATTPAKTNNPQPSPASAAKASPEPNPSQSTSANRISPSEPRYPYLPLFTSVPDLGVGFPIKKTPLNPFVRPR